MISGPEQDQCLCSVLSPTPLRSIDGLERVKVIQTQLAKHRLAKSESSTRVTKAIFLARSGWWSIVADSWSIAAFKGNFVSIAIEPTEHSLGLEKSELILKSDGIQLRRSLRLGPEIGITSFDP